STIRPCFALDPDDHSVSGLADCHPDREDDRCGPGSAGGWAGRRDGQRGVAGGHTPGLSGEPAREERRQHDQVLLKQISWAMKKRNSPGGVKENRPARVFAATWTGRNSLLTLGRWSCS